MDGGIQLSLFSDEKEQAVSVPEKTITVPEHQRKASVHMLIMPFYNTNCMNVFLKELSQAYPEDKIILVCDGATWHKSKEMIIPENIELFLFLHTLPK